MWSFNGMGPNVYSIHREGDHYIVRRWLLEPPDERLVDTQEKRTAPTYQEALEYIPPGAKKIREICLTFPPGAISCWR
jgi:hypothetical protein